MNVAIGIIAVLAPTALFLWVYGKTRRGTFFSVRVEPGFAESDDGRAIMKNFRRRVWLWTLPYSLLYAVSFRFDRPTANFLRYFVGVLMTIVDIIIFAKASKETRVKALPMRAPPARTAALFTAEEERSFWLAIVDWLAILLPVIFPVATAVLFVLSWPQIPLDNRRLLILLGIAGPMSIVAAFSYFALRFRARSRDWNPDPRASRKYRTMLGIATISFPTFLIFVICFACVSVAVPLKEATQWRLVEVFLAAIFLGFPVLFFGFFGILWWLRRKFSAESGDPMPDRCWKWGFFYFNSDDPALVVPLRSGISFSYNCARRPIWWFVLGPMIVSLIFLFFCHPPYLPSVPVPTSQLGTRQLTPPTTRPAVLSGQRGRVTSLAASSIKTKVNPKDGLTYVWIPPGTFEMGCSPGMIPNVTRQDIHTAAKNHATPSRSVRVSGLGKRR